MLIQRFINTLPIEKMKKLSMNFLSEMNDRKERKKRKIVNQNKTNVCEKVARYVVRRQPSSYLIPNTASAPIV